MAQNILENIGFVINIRDCMSPGPHIESKVFQMSINTRQRNFSVEHSSVILGTISKVLILVSVHQVGALLYQDSQLGLGSEQINTTSGLVHQHRKACLGLCSYLNHQAASLGLPSELFVPSSIRVARQQTQIPHKKLR